MGDMADLLMDQAFDEWAEGGGMESYEDICARTPSHVWVTNAGSHILISKMDVQHAKNAVRMLRRWVRYGIGESGAEIVGIKRWRNLLKKSGLK